MIAAHLRHDLGDPAHTADAVAPRALLAVHLAEDVVEEDIGAARRVGAGVIADHGVEAEGGLHRFAFEPGVEHRARRFGEKVEHIALLFEAEGRKSSEEHTSELQSLMRISYAVFFLKKPTHNTG